MGLDEALLAQARQGAALSLRLYRWDGPWLSLGYAQQPDAALIARCAAAGLGVVRRITGGAAVLHGNDLTYAITAAADSLPEGLAGAHAFVAEMLCDALRSLGVAAERSVGAARVPGEVRAFDCFVAPSRDELCAAGRKLVGSAQRREDGALLQHGSIRLRCDSGPVAEAAGLGLAGATSLAELGADATPERVASAVVDAFTRRLGASPDTLALDEALRASAARRGIDPPARTHSERAAAFK